LSGELALHRIHQMRLEVSAQVHSRSDRFPSRNSVGGSQKAPKFLITRGLRAEDRWYKQFEIDWPRRSTDLIPRVDIDVNESVTKGDYPLGAGPCNTAVSDGSCLYQCCERSFKRVAMKRDLASLRQLRNKWIAHPGVGRKQMSLAWAQ
jgi:hypothetical protein